MKMLYLIIAILPFFASCEKEQITKPIVDTDTTKIISTNKFEMIWSKIMDENPTGFVSLAPAISEHGVGIVKMFGGPSNTFTMRDAKTGDIKWTFSDPVDIADGSEITAAKVVNGSIILSGGNQLYAINATTGATNWKYDLNQFQTCAFPRFGIFGGYIYHGHSDCAIPFTWSASFVRTRIDAPRWETLIGNLSKQEGGPKRR